MNLNTADLDLLLRVVRLGSFAAAARELNRDPSAVSRAIAELEAQLGVRLFQRSTRRLVLTEAGTRFTERLAPVLDELEQALNSAIETAGALRGRLRISASNTFGLRRVVPLLPEFCARHPLLDIDLMLSDTVVDVLTEHVDVAVRMGSLGDSALIAVPLADVHYRVVASPQWLQRQLPPPLLPADLQRVQCLSFALPGFRERWLFRRHDGTSSEAVRLRPRVEMTSGLALRDCVLQHMGASLLPDWLIDADLASGALVDLFPQYRVAVGEAPSRAWAVYPSRRHVPAKTRVFIEFLRASLATARAP